MSSLPYPGLQFDQQAAQEAITTLQSAHALLSDQTGSRQVLGNQALEYWQGAYAEQFRGDFASMVSGADSLLGQIVQTIQAISQASAEFARQVQANAAWQQQQQQQAAARARAAKAQAAQTAAAAQAAKAAQAAAAVAAAAAQATPSPPAAVPTPPEPGTGTRHF